MWIVTNKSIHAALLIQFNVLLFCLKVKLFYKSIRLYVTDKFFVTLEMYLLPFRFKTFQDHSFRNWVPFLIIYLGMLELSYRFLIQLSIMQKAKQLHNHGQKFRTFFLNIWNSLVTIPYKPKISILWIIKVSVTLWGNRRNSLSRTRNI